jgi:hypothetical protein
MARDVVLLIALLAIGGLAFLTVKVLIEDGIDVLVVVSFVILALLGFGVLGALTSPPDDR